MFSVRKFRFLTITIYRKGGENMKLTHTTDIKLILTGGLVNSANMSVITKQYLYMFDLR